MKLLKKSFFEEKLIEEIELGMFVYKHMRMLQKKELYENNEIKYRIAASLIKSMTLEDGTVITDESKIRTFINQVNLIDLNRILIESKKLEIEPEDERYYWNQLQDCPNCNKKISLPFDVTDPEPINDIPDLEINNYVVKFKLPLKKDEQYILKHQDELIDGLFRLYVKEINGSDNFDEIPNFVVTKTMKYLEKYTKMGFFKDYDCECHFCHKTFTTGIDTGIDRFFD